MSPRSTTNLFATVVDTVASLVFVFDPDGSLVLFVSTGIDVTDARRAEVAIGARAG